MQQKEYPQLKTEAEFYNSELPDNLLNSDTFYLFHNLQDWQREYEVCLAKTQAIFLHLLMKKKLKPDLNLYFVHEPSLVRVLNLQKLQDYLSQGHILIYLLFYYQL